MAFKQFNAFIDLIDQPTVCGQLMDVADSAMSRALMTPVNVVVNISAGHHRLGLLRPTYLFEAFCDFSLAFCQFFTDILLHSKCSFRISGFIFSQANNTLNLKTFQAFY